LEVLHDSEYSYNLIIWMEDNFNHL